MILLLGGTGESCAIAQALLDAGHEVMVSTATDTLLALPAHPRLRRRCGKLDQAELESLLRAEHIAALVDATHPYACEIRAIAPLAASACGIPYLSYIRPALAGDAVALRAANHDEAAQLAFGLGKPVLLTTGSRHLAPYLKLAEKTGIACHARILPESINECLATGWPQDRIIAKRGPFTEEENRAAIRELHIGVIVTKDGGAAGGLPAKLAAAQKENCAVVLVERPLAQGKHLGRIEDIAPTLAGMLA